MNKKLQKFYLNTIGCSKNLKIYKNKQKEKNQKNCKKKQALREIYRKNKQYSKEILLPKNLGKIPKKKLK